LTLLVDEAVDLLLRVDVAGNVLLVVKILEGSTGEKQERSVNGENERRCRTNCEHEGGKEKEEATKTYLMLNHALVDSPLRTVISR
jgi:hypothetical protein